MNYKTIYGSNRPVWKDDSIPLIPEQTVRNNYETAFSDMHSYRLNNTYLF